MDERNVKLFASFLRNSPVAADHDDVRAGVEELVGLGGELVPPLVVERIEDVSPHLGEPAVEAAVGQSLGLVPLDVRVHVAEDAVHVVPRERLVGPFDDVDIVHPRRLRSVRYALHPDEDGPRFETGGFTQRVGPLAGSHLDARADEVVYVLDGDGRLTVAGQAHDLRPGIAVFVARGTEWAVDGDARGISVLIHEPEPASGHAVIDLDAAERGEATAGREFVLGATPDAGCASVTQFVGLIPPGRAPDHFHTYDEVIYVLDGDGVLEIEGEQAPLRAGTCVHLPARLVHCLANTGESELRVLGVFRPAGSPAEAYYPDGTLAVLES
jgi:quercetin dioxygenase-like cupin family protein